MLLSDRESHAPLFLSVAIARPFNQLFTYQVPRHLLPELEVGKRVRIPFGRAKVEGYIVNLNFTSKLPNGMKIEQIKEIESILDAEPLFSPEIFSLCKWVHQYYHAAFGEALQAAYPKGALKKKEPKKSRQKKKKLLEEASQPFRPHVLTEEQASAIEFLDEARQRTPSHCALLQGVTGSGKTEVYIELAQRTLAEGKSVLILLPEIALTSQLHDRFQAGLGVPIGLWHSSITPSLRQKEMELMRNGILRAVVGARSAIFAPLPRLGLIIVDEEHDAGYKQQDRVRYHARDLAVYRGKLIQALVVLGSATPSLETLERVKEGRYLKAQLTSRVSGRSLPEIEIVDLKKSPRMKKIQAPIAQETLTKIRQTLLQGEQVMIYLNRRGFAAFLVCQDCGQVKECTRCSISLTVYKKEKVLRCHLCGHKERISDQCQKCLGYRLEAVGAGTESLETELPLLLPQAKIVRLDRDQVTSVSRLDQILEEFRLREHNVMLGTQMLVKGHDFPGVTLVVVILADSLFHWPDFRSGEKAFQVLTQVAGRAGRGDKKGQVLIQAYDTEHPVLKVLKDEISESAFVESEREMRKALTYPPFGRLARVRVERKKSELALKDAESIAKILRSKSEVSELQVLGPSEAMFKRIKGVYRFDILLKAKNVSVLHEALNYLDQVGSELFGTFSLDIDPIGNG